MAKYILMFAIAIGCLGFSSQSYAAVPIANAGPDQTVYAWIDFMAAVTLDGSGSSDADGDTLTYQWTWSVDGNNYDTDEAAPEIELPVGVHVITLVVSDGNTASAPDEVVVTVVEPLEVQMKFTPQTLNCKSKGKWVKAHFKLPKGYKGMDVDKQETATLEPYGLPAIRIQASGKSRNVTISYDRGTFARALIGDANETAEVTAVGQFKSGQYFFGTDTIKVLNSVPKPPKEKGNGKK
jgi:hypothetical protein